MMEYSYGITVISIIIPLLVITVFTSLHYRKVLKKNAYIDNLERELHILEKSISETVDLITLRPLLKKELTKIFQTKVASLEMYQEGENPGFFEVIREYFREYPSDRAFANNENFIANLDDELLRKKLQGIIPPEIAFIFPIFSTQGFHIGNLLLGIKRSGMTYIKDEVEFLKEFSFFIEIHLKYIRTYTLMHEFSALLDEKVDTKTIAYNNLINRQKEFIKVISHEVRSPLTSAIFQVESAIESLEGESFQKNSILVELQELRAQLVRTGGLISKLFSVEYYDNDNVSLFREAIHLPKFLEYEIELFSRTHQDIAFISQIDINVGFVPIDKVQFQQVLTNLVDNAIKFTSTTNPIVYLSANKLDNRLIITVEDNGKGFSNNSMKYIFDKYNTGINKNIGLGLGLYLCRKIVTMHNGTINASNSNKYGGACFTISIPISHQFS